MEGAVREMRSDRIPEKELTKYHLKGNRSFEISPKRWNLLNSMFMVTVHLSI